MSHSIVLLILLVSSSSWAESEGKVCSAAESIKSNFMRGNLPVVATMLNWLKLEAESNSNFMAMRCLRGTDNEYAPTDFYDQMAADTTIQKQMQINREEALHRTGEAKAQFNIMLSDPNILAPTANANSSEAQTGLKLENAPPSAKPFKCVTWPKEKVGESAILEMISCGTCADEQVAETKRLHIVQYESLPIEDQATYYHKYYDGVGDCWSNAFIYRSHSSQAPSHH